MTGVLWKKPSIAPRGNTDAQNSPNFVRWPAVVVQITDRRVMCHIGLSSFPLDARSIVLARGQLDRSESD